MGLTKSKAFFSILLLILSFEAYALGEKQYLFSEMTGIVNFEGQPASGVRLLRKIENKEVDEVTTDKNGYFKFPVIYQKASLFVFLLTEFVVKQYIIAYKDGKEYEMWAGIKRRPEVNAESRGKPLEITCELTLEEENYIKVNDGPIFSLCTWDVEADPSYANESPFGDSRAE
ncbi:MAG: DUF4198 domain-containing protein [Alteromonadales bacterium]|nr:DUF4198 domain-containing protein [Alteromonadales bacterium]